MNEQTAPEPSFHLFDVRSLINEFKAGTVTERRRFHYLLADLILVTILLSLMTQSFPIAPDTAFLDFILAIVVTIAGTTWCYNVNSANDNKDFIARYIALSFVLSVRLLGILFLIFIALGIFVALSGNIGTAKLFESYAVSTAVYLLFSFIFYYLLKDAIGEVSSSSR